MRHPFRKRGAVAGVARIRHLSHDEQLHLLLEIKRAAELQRLSVVRADSSAEISQVRPADGERRARHHAGAIVAEKHSPQDRCDIDRRRVERDILGCFSRALDPVNVLFGALLQEDRDAFPRLANAPSQFLQFCLEEFVLGLADHFADPHLERGEPSGNLIVDKIRFPDAKFASVFLEVRAFIDRSEKSDRLRRRAKPPASPRRHRASR